MTLPNPHTWLRLQTKNSDKVSYTWTIKSTFFFSLPVMSLKYDNDKAILESIMKKSIEIDPSLKQSNYYAM